MTTPLAAGKHLDWWLNARFGMSLHWGLYSIPGRGEWIRSSERLTIEQCQPFFDTFSPDVGCCREWARLAREAGAQYVVLTAKHHDGFCLWDSALTDYKATNTLARRDLIREYVEALRAEGLRVGLYYSLVDWHHPDYGPVFGDRQHPLRHDPHQRQLDPSRDWSRYVQYMHGQVEELMSNYGTIDVLFFDFSYWDFAGEQWGATELMQKIRKVQPNVVVNDRLGSEEIKSASPQPYVGDFDHAEQNIPRHPVVDAAGRRVPWEAWFTLTNSWCHSEGDQDYKSAATVVRALVNCVSKGGNLCLNIAPDGKGHLADKTIEIVSKVGKWLAANGESIYGCGPANLPKPDWGRYTLSRDGRRLFAHVLDQQIGHISLEGLRGWVEQPHVLSSNRPAMLIDYWNPGVQTFDAPDDVFLNTALPPQATWPLPDELDTVIRLDVVNDPAKRQAITQKMSQAHEVALQRVPFD
ncbi:MAG TPA: alpha-L-fucosidase [Tepidisphaeraceae bacterium]